MDNRGKQENMVTGICGRRGAISGGAGGDEGDDKEAGTVFEKKEIGTESREIADVGILNGKREEKVSIMEVEEGKYTIGGYSEIPRICFEN